MQLLLLKPHLLLVLLLLLLLLQIAVDLMSTQIGQVRSTKALVSGRWSGIGSIRVCANSINRILEITACARVHTKLLHMTVRSKPVVLGPIVQKELNVRFRQFCKPECKPTASASLRAYIACQVEDVASSVED